MRVFLLFRLCASLFCVYSSESGTEGVYHLSNESWPRLEGVVSTYFSGVR